jgi:WD40 repeat protein
MKRAAVVGLLCLAGLSLADDSVDRIPDSWRPFAQTKLTRLTRVLGEEKPLADRFTHFGVSPDGKWVAYCDKVVQIATRKVGLELTTPNVDDRENQLTATIFRAEGLRRFTPDGRRLIACSPDIGGGDCPVAVAFDLKTRAEVRFTTPDATTGCPWDLAFVQSTNTAVVVLDTGGVWLWATDGSKAPVKIIPAAEVAKSTPERRSAWSVDVASDGRRALTCAGPEITLWDITTGKNRVLEKVPPRERAPSVFRAVFTKDGKDGLSVDAKGVVKKWNLAKGEATKVGALPANESWSAVGSPSPPAVFSRDRKLLVYGHGRATLSIFDVTAGQEIDRLDLGPVSDTLTDLVFAPDDRTLYVGTATTKKILVFEVAHPLK